MSSSSSCDHDSLWEKQYNKSTFVPGLLHWLLQHGYPGRNYSNNIARQTALLSGNVGEQNPLPMTPPLSQACSDIMLT